MGEGMTIDEFLDSLEHNIEVADINEKYHIFQLAVDKSLDLYNRGFLTAEELAKRIEQAHSEYMAGIAKYINTSEEVFGS